MNERLSKGFEKCLITLTEKKYFKTFNGDKLNAKLSLSWKTSFSMGVIIPHKMRNCNKCTKDVFCENWDELVNRKKKFSANLDELKREAPN